jgi:anti-sigma factor RsiW
VTDPLTHPQAEQFEELVAGSLSAGDQAVLESHLTGCEYCRQELDEVRALFSALAELPRLEPSPAFADRVMAHVRVHQPWAVRAAAWAKGFWPQSTIGLGLATAFFALPPLLFGAGLAWLASVPGMSWQALWIYGQSRALLLAQSATSALFSFILGSDWMLALGGAAQNAVTVVDPTRFAAFSVFIALLCALSARVLYTNMIRPLTRDVSHARYRLS